MTLRIVARYAVTAMVQSRNLWEEFRASPDSCEMKKNMKRQSYNLNYLKCRIQRDMHSLVNPSASLYAIVK